VLAQRVPEAALADAEQARGARFDPLRLVERLEDDVALEGLTINRWRGVSSSTVPSGGAFSTRARAKTRVGECHKASKAARSMRVVLELRE